MSNECRDIREAIEDLGKKIDLNNRNGGGGSGGSGGGNSDLEKRVKELEQQMLAVDRYINALDQAGENIAASVKTLANIFSFFRI